MFVAKKVIVFIAVIVLVISIVFVASCATNDPLDLMYVRDLYTYDTGTATWVKLPGAGGAGDMLRAVYDPDLNGVFATAQLDTTVVVEGDVDDVPVNGATTDPISSNWAFDHNADVTTKHLPAQAGNAGEFLTTDGAVASWAVNGNGDMTKAVYDADTDNVADKAQTAFGLWEFHLNDTLNGGNYGLDAPTYDVESSVDIVFPAFSASEEISFQTTAATGITSVPTGAILVHIEVEKTAGTKSVSMDASLYERTALGVENFIATSYVGSTWVTDRVAIDIPLLLDAAVTVDPTSFFKLYITANAFGGGTAPTVRIYLEGSTYSRVVAPSGLGGFDAQKVRAEIADVVDDTPVNGATTDPISSNWAFDHTASATSHSGIADADADTKIQTEESADEDKIRFDTGGTERLILDSNGLDFKTLKAIAMSCDNGATIPASPVVGQWFLHTPTGRNILMQYSGTAWIPIISFGAMTLYVDNTDGTDSAAKGTGVDAAAFKTIQYAVNTIPGLVGGSVVININAETYAETVSIAGKSFTGTYTITLQGTLTESASATMDSGVQGTGATQGSITDAGAFGSYDNKLIYANSTYRLIDSDTANTATIVGTWGSAPSGVYKVYDWGTLVNCVVLEFGQANIIINDIKLTGEASTTTVLDPAPATQVSLNRVWMTGRIAGFVGTNHGYNKGATIKLDIVYGQDGGTSRVIQSAGNVEVWRSKFLATSGTLIDAFLSSFVFVTAGTILDLTSKPATSFAIGATQNSLVDLYTTAADGYVRIRNADTGIRAIYGATVTSTANVQYSNNNTNENAVAASYSYID